MGKKDWEAYFISLKKQDWETAKNTLQRLSQEDKNNPQIFLKIGDIYQRTGDHSNAITSYLQAGRILQAQGFVNKALAAYKIILRLDPKHTEVIERAKRIMDEMDAEKGIRALTAMKEMLTPPRMLSAKKEIDEEKIEIESGHDEEWLESAYSAIDKSVIRPKPSEIPDNMKDLLLPISEKQETSIPKIFSDLPEDVARGFISGLTLRFYGKDQKVIEEGDSGDTMYLIKSGRAKVVAHLLGREIELAMLESGDIFGEVGFLTGRPRTASVIAAGPLEVLEINRVDIEKIIELNPEIMSRIEEFYETRVMDTIRKVKS